MPTSRWISHFVVSSFLTLRRLFALKRCEIFLSAVAYFFTFCCWKIKNQKAQRCAILKGVANLSDIAPTVNVSPHLTLSVCVNFEWSQVNMLKVPYLRGGNMKLAAGTNKHSQRHAKLTFELTDRGIIVRAFQASVFVQKLNDKLKILAG